MDLVEVLGVGCPRTASQVPGCTTRHQRVGWLANRIRALSHTTAGSRAVTLCVTIRPCIPPFGEQTALASSLFAAPIGPGPGAAETVRHNA
jgi:hypothetical protein